MTYRALVLFDIDGTLVRRAGPHHREALVHGVRSVTGLETTTEGIPVQGMLDPDIVAAMMRRAGATPAFRETLVGAAGRGRLEGRDHGSNPCGRQRHREDGQGNTRRGLR